MQSTLAEEANESDDDKSHRLKDASSDDSCDSDSDDDDSDSDSDDDDDESESNEPPAKRVTRHSQAVVKSPDARSLRRLTRSRK